MAGSKLQADMVEALWSCLRYKDIKKLQIAFEKPNFTPNMLLPSEPEKYFRTNNKYTLLNWACYCMFEEAIAFLMLKGGDPFLQAKKT